MKLQQTQYQTKSTVIDEERHDLTVDNKNIQSIMDILTGQYPNPVLAALREYCVNALDSHKEARTSRPIEVSLPTNLNPVLEIRDFGIGMSRDELMHLYTRYGYSSKSDTNELTGGLGLGSKSALALVDLFMIEAVKDGKKNTASIGRNKSGKGYISNRPEEDTDEPNGVKVVIPLQSDHIKAMQKEARTFFYMLKPGTFTLKNATFDTSKNLWSSKMLNIENKVLIVEHNTHVHLLGMKVLMGDICYPIDQSLIFPAYKKRCEELGFKIHPGMTSTNNRFAEIFICEIGSLQIAPSRETLLYSKEVINKLVDIIIEKEEAYSRHNTDFLNKCRSHYEALQKVSERFEYFDSRFFLDNKNIQYGGLSLPSSIKYEGKDYDTCIIYCADGFDRLNQFPHRLYAQGQSHIFKGDLSLPVRAFHSCIVIDDYPKTPSSPDLPSPHRKKIQHYLHKNNLPKSTCVFLKTKGSKPFSPWLDGSPTVEWSEVEKIALKESASTNTATVPSPHLKTIVKRPPDITKSPYKEYTNPLSFRNEVSRNIKDSSVQLIDTHNEIDTQTIQDDVPIVVGYIPESIQSRSYNFLTLSRIMTHLAVCNITNYQLVEINKVRRPRFMKAYPQAMTLGDFIVKHREQIWRYTNNQVGSSTAATRSLYKLEHNLNLPNNLIEIATYANQRDIDLLDPDIQHIKCLLQELQTLLLSRPPDIDNPRWTSSSMVLDEARRDLLNILGQVEPVILTHSSDFSPKAEKEFEKKVSECREKIRQSFPSSKLEQIFLRYPLIDDRDIHWGYRSRRTTEDMFNYIQAMHAFNHKSKDVS